jgi:glycosyltransferase involved in cell wall biosynthesis
MPKVSVCIPAYNQVKYLKKCIDSVLSQNFSDFELVITDDSPGDIVKDLIAQYNLPDKINYYKNQPSLGSPGNWNAAIGRSTGEYIKVLHHDDWLTDDTCLLKFVRLLDEHPEADFAFCASKIFHLDKSEGAHRISRDDVENIKRNPLLLYASNLIGGPSATIYRRNTSLLFDTRLKWLVDIDLYIRLLADNRNIVYSPELLVTTGAVEGRITDECIDNKEVEVTEYLHVLHSITTGKNHFSNRQKRKCIETMIRILEKYNISSDDSILKQQQVLGAIGFYLHMKNIFPFGARVFRKLL